jgi:GNAT superfamily N-acetyltransferase
MAPSLTEPQRRTLYEYTAFDARLIDDGTYYVLEVDGRIAASGGWSRRAALVRRAGGDAAPERFLDARSDSAAIRAMYTHPDYARLGLGSILLAAVEAAARLAGFGRAELRHVGWPGTLPRARVAGGEADYVGPRRRQRHGGEPHGAGAAANRSSG